MAATSSQQTGSKATPAAAAPARLESLTVAPISLISGEVELPGSKSLSNRVLLLSALSEVIGKKRAAVFLNKKWVVLG